MPRCLHAIAAAGLLLDLGPAAWAQTSSLQVGYASGGTTAPEVATCVKGSYLYGNYTNICDGAQPSTAAVAGDTLTGWGWATFANGMSSQAWGTAAFGTLKAYAQSNVPDTADGLHNTQSRGAASMYDLMTSGNSVGSATTTYKYTIVVNGTLSAPQGSFTGVFPLSSGFVSVGFSVSPVCYGCGNVVANWNASSGEVASTVYSGTFTVPTGIPMQMNADIDTSTYINTEPFQSAFAEANYGDTMHVYLDAVTPGANTVGASGFNYASPVPEPAPTALLLTGLAGLALRRARQR